MTMPQINGNYASVFTPLLSHFLTITWSPSKPQLTAEKNRAAQQPACTPCSGRQAGPGSKNRFWNRPVCAGVRCVRPHTAGDAGNCKWYRAVAERCACWTTRLDFNFRETFKIKCMTLFTHSSNTLPWCHKMDFLEFNFNEMKRQFFLPKISKIEKIDSFTLQFCCKKRETIANPFKIYLYYNTLNSKILK